MGVAGPAGTAGCMPLPPVHAVSAVALRDAIMMALFTEVRFPRAPQVRFENRAAGRSALICRSPPQRKR